MSRRAATIAAASLIALAAAAPAAARTVVQPYVEAQQLLSTNLTGDGFADDVLTYTSLAAGVDAAVATPRTQATLSYRYEHRFSWDNDVPDVDIHSGLARIGYRVSENLTLDAGAIATRARTDLRGVTPVILTGDVDNVSQVYGLYAGPSYNRMVGDLLVGGDYRFGYTRVDDSYGFRPLPGQPGFDSFTSSTNHSADVHVGMNPGPLPFGWTATAGYVAEDLNRFHQKWRAKFVRGDVLVPIDPTLAVTGGIGYEDLRATQSNFLRDASGVPVNAGGFAVEDRAAPRLLVYDRDGLTYDAGVVWKPNTRTRLEAHYGKRWGTRAVTGQLDYRISETLGLTAGVYNSIDSFGRGLTNSVAALPVSFQSPVNPLIGTLTPCVFGTAPGTGGCIDSALQSTTNGNFRNRGAFIVLNGSRGLWTYGAGLSYANRRYLAPLVIGIPTLAGIEDESLTAQASLGRRLSAQSSLTGTVFGAWYDSGLVDSSGVYSYGATAVYARQFGRSLSGQAAVALFATDAQDFDTTLTASLLLGLRYGF